MEAELERWLEVKDGEIKELASKKREVWYIRQAGYIS